MEEVTIALTVSTAVGLVLATWKPPPDDDTPEGSKDEGEEKDGEESEK